MTTLLSRLEKNWCAIISGEFESGEFEQHLVQLEQFLRLERANGTVYPKDEQIFNALDLTPFEKVKVVIIGQDPYPGPGQAHGLCFSVPRCMPIPRSLRNIYNEIDDEYRTAKMPSHGDLTGWAAQGVLLLNATLTVRKGNPGPHRKGWEKFTDAIIFAINKKREPVVFLLWGRSAQKNSAQIDREKHRVLETSHPSGLSAYRGFLGCGHFRKTDEYLIQNRLKPILWQKT